MLCVIEKDRRKDRRRLVSIPARLNGHRVRLTDLSLGGVGIEVTEATARRALRLRPGRKATLRFGGRGEPVGGISLHIRRVSPLGDCIGAMFLKLTNAQFDFVQSLMINPRRY